MDSKWGPAKTEAEAELPDTDKFLAIEYAWLCSPCCRDMTVHIDHEGKIRVVRKPDSEWTRVGNFEAESKLQREIGALSRSQLPLDWQID